MREPDRDQLQVLIADDHAVVRQGIRAFLSVLPDIAIVGEAADGGGALARLHELGVAGALPDVVLTDLVMPGTDGIATIAAIRERYPTVAVVAMTSFSEAERVHAALAAGAAGYVLKDAEADEVARAIRTAAAGEVHLDPAVARKVARALTGATEGVASLSAREREVLVLVAKGLSNDDIARELDISERTARTHVSNILLKVGVTSRTQAALWAIREGVAPAP